MTTNFAGISDEDLEREFRRRKQEQARFPFGRKSPVGWWRVTTEGDCEGRSTKDLGVHHGHIGEILMQLAGQACYGLYVSAADIPPETPVPAPRTSVEVWLSGSGISDRATFQSWLGPDFWLAGQGSLDNRVTIKRLGR